MAEPIDHLIHALSKLPSIGGKSAQRLAFHILRAPNEYARELADAIMSVKQEMRSCQVCQAPSHKDPCTLCSDPRRDAERICVVEEPADVSAIEKTGVYRGKYHVLHGRLSPLDGITPQDLKIDALIRRLQSGPCREVILATNPNVEGEATATYIAGLLRPFGSQITRLASGMPLGAEVEYIDCQTLAVALESRRAL